MNDISMCKQYVIRNNNLVCKTLKPKGSCLYLFGLERGSFSLCSGYSLAFIKCVCYSGHTSNFNHKMLIFHRSRISALAALQSGDKKLALRNARQLKLASESREKLTSLFNRVDEVLRVITEAESAKKVCNLFLLLSG